MENLIETIEKFLAYSDEKLEELAKENQKLRERITELEFENSRLKGGDINKGINTPEEQLTNAEQLKQAKERLETFRNARII